MILAVGWNRLKKRGPGISCFKPTRRCIRPAQGTLSWYGTTVSIWWEAKDLLGKEVDGFGNAKKPAVWGRRWLPTFFFWTPKMGIIQALWAEAAIWTMKNTPVGWFTWGMKCYPLWGVWNRRWNTHWNPKSNKFRWNHPVGRDSAAICFGSHAVSHERVRFLYTA